MICPSISAFSRERPLTFRRSSPSSTAGENSEEIKIVVGGHSSGGGLAIRFAGSRHAANAAGYLLLAPFLKHYAPTTRNDAGGWAKTHVWRIVFLSILNGFGIRSMNHPVVIEFAMPEAAQ